MKVLFAVNSESISDSIIKKYQKDYREILSYKNVYYFNAIQKEIQKDKTYDRIVISVDLEPFSTNNYESIDKFLFEKLDGISDEAHDADGNEISIILICSDRHTKGSSFLVKLFGIGVYNALLGNDRSMEEVCRLINKPRTKKEAKIYYKIDTDDVNYRAESEDEVDEMQIQNILAHFRKLGKNTAKYAGSFENIAAQYNEQQLKIIINCLPINVKKVLESTSEKYQEIMAANGVMVQGVNSNTIGTEEDQKRTGLKIDIIENKMNQTKMSGPIVIPNSVKKTKSATAKKVIAVPQAGQTAEVQKEKTPEIEKQVEQVSENIQTEEPVKTEKNKVKVKVVRLPDGRIVKKKVVPKKKDVKEEEMQEPKVVKPERKIVHPEPQKEENLDDIELPDLDFVNEKTQAQKPELLEKPKRGRGRPRKYPEVPKEDKPKRGRGRPRKIAEVIEEDNSQEDLEEVSTEQLNLDSFEPEDLTEELNTESILQEELQDDDFVMDENEVEELPDDAIDDEEFDLSELEGLEDLENLEDIEEPQDSGDLEGIDDLEDLEDLEDLDDLDNLDDAIIDETNDDVDEDILTEEDDDEFDLSALDDLEDIDDLEEADDDVVTEEAFDEFDEYDEYGQYETTSKASEQEKDIDELYEEDILSDESDLATDDLEEDLVVEDEVDDEADDLISALDEEDIEDFETDEVDEEVDVDTDDLLSGLDDSDDITDIEDVNEDYLSELDDDNLAVDDELLDGSDVDDELLSGLDTSDDELLSGIDENTDDLISSVEEDELSDYQEASLESIESPIDYSMSNLNSLMTKDKKIVTFIGTSKNGVSFLINNLAEIFASVGINTAILDMTKNRNSYYIYTQNEESLRQIAYSSIDKLQKGVADGIRVKQNLTVYTALPNDGKIYPNVEEILSTLVQNHSLILIDCDFETNPAYFGSSQEIYLVQSMDILTIQPLTAFLRDLKTQGAFEPEKVRVVINKELKVRGLTSKAIIGGMSSYNDPAMSFMTELFNKEIVKYCSIPFDEMAYSRYLEGMLNCKVSISNYSKNFMAKLRVLGDMVYPLTSRQTYSPNQSQTVTQNNFSNSMNDTLNKMKKKF